jgi:transketolase
MKTQRDIFINDLYEQAQTDKDIILISVDMGAPALDIWRETLPDQFIAAGISEQNAINVAAGLANSGKKVYVYFMAAWVARCFEQIRYSCAMANNPITILGNGVALGYAPAGPAHEPNEDIAYMRSINGIEIWSPSNLQSTQELVKLTLEKPALRYIRLERTFAKEIEDYTYNIDNTVYPIKKSIQTDFTKPRVVILSSGYMLGRAYKVWEELNQTYQIDIYDLWKIKPLNTVRLNEVLEGYTHIVTLEEQTLDGGFGSAVCESICDNDINIRVLRLGLPSKFIFENGTRDHLLNTNGLSVDKIINKIITFVK